MSKEAVKPEELNDELELKVGETTSDAGADATADDAAVGTIGDEEDDFFSAFELGTVSENDRDAIVERIVKAKRGKVLKGLHVKNVVVNKKDGHAFVTFVVKENILGNIDLGKRDEFGDVVLEPGISNNAVVGSYALVGAMKEIDKVRHFANEIRRDLGLFVVDNTFTSLPEDLFMGGTIDLLIEKVNAKEDYVNPFAKDGDATKFAHQRVVHHIIGMTFGDLGEELYASKKSRK